VEYHAGQGFRIDGVGTRVVANGFRIAGVVGKNLPGKGNIYFAMIFFDQRFNGLIT
jgi:hypothetical protein